MAFRDKVRGPLGWILGVVGGLALLLGSFFAGMATADTSVDQEQASVTEQQEDARNQDAEDGAESGPESGPESEDQDRGAKPDQGTKADKGTKPDRDGRPGHPGGHPMDGDHHDGDGDHHIEEDGGPEQDEGAV
ncbi:hypothetical protein J2M53_09450 [Arthrobacter sp. zg-ZUI100]|uniref:hypothetical protein n=1 Tax=Arthrobacter jiangjiafuii TaxID=2817475 RepID=UPI001AEEFF20|nr:hypothetical protein [Arthrobacter jiangjiafuii]MBP3036477.1 hypothetical protein [Arthrobacter jiangjiafuii]